MKILKYLLAGFVGFVVAVYYVFRLWDLNVIVPKGYWGSECCPQNEHLALLIPAAGVLVGLLVALGRKGWLPALAITLLCLVPLFNDIINPPPAKAAEREQRQYAARTKRGALKLARQTHPSATDVTVDPGHSSCPGVLVWTHDGGKDTWYWYDGIGKRFAASATADQVMNLITRYLPEGARITRLTADKDHPYEISFDFDTPTSTRSGEARIGLGCQFELDLITYYDGGSTVVSEHPNAPLGQ